MGADQTQKRYFNFTCHLCYEVITQFSQRKTYTRHDKVRIKSNILTEHLSNLNLNETQNIQ